MTNLIQDIKLALRSARGAGCGNRGPGHSDSRRDRTDRRAQVTIGPARGRSLQARIVLHTNLSVAELWSRVSDLTRFLTHDPFHERVTLMRREPAIGVDVVLLHNAFGLRFFRFGRILRWHESSAYAFSDLSARGPKQGFPHVFFVGVEKANGDGPDRSRLTIDVKGKWTSHWIPLWCARRWARYVCVEHGRILREKL